MTARSSSSRSAASSRSARCGWGPSRAPARRATLVDGDTVHTLLADPAAAGAIEPPGPPLAYLYEPDPAVLRAGLVTTLAAQLGARQLDPDIAYLTAATTQPTALARAFAIEAALPFQLKRLREALRARGVGRVTVKKRGSPLEPETLIRQLRLSGPEEADCVPDPRAGRAVGADRKRQWRTPVIGHSTAYSSSTPYLVCPGETVPVEYYLPPSCSGLWSEITCLLQFSAGSGFWARPSIWRAKTQTCSSRRCIACWSAPWWRSLARPRWWRWPCWPAIRSPAKSACMCSGLC